MGKADQNLRLPSTVIIQNGQARAGATRQMSNTMHIVPSSAAPAGLLEEKEEIKGKFPNIGCANVIRLFNTNGRGLGPAR
jgi:hypothetical protein